MPLILHIDDDQAVRDVIRETLTLSGLEIDSAEKLVDGIQLALARKPDLILLDVHMPEGDGIETLITIRAVPELAGVPVVMLTGTRDMAHREKAKALGVVGYVTKPFAAQELLATIKRRLSV